MAAEDDLWAEVHDLFDTNDGSLPEIVLTDVPGEAFQPVFSLLMQRGTTDGTLWDRAKDIDVPLSQAPDAGHAVAAGRLPDFHAVFADIRVDGVTLPAVGAYFCIEEIALDYRMGEHWTPATLAAFCRFLAEMRDLAPGASLRTRPDGAFLDDGDAGFERALNRYLCALTPQK